MTGSTLRLAGLRKAFGGGHPAVDDVSLDVEGGALLGLLGPSGCGKTTTLSMVAGLIPPDAGDVVIDGRSVVAVRPERRDVGLVQQRPLLFPHLSVAQNVAFGLHVRRTGRAETTRRVGEMLEHVQLGGLTERRVGELSGGQEQRVALARALVLRPSVLLLDEPFSQLDAGLRSEMRDLVRNLQRELAVTTVFVTHDHAEAVAVADRIVLMIGGRVEAAAAPETFYRRPPTLAAARFFGVHNEIPGRVRAGTFRSRWLDVAAAGSADGDAVAVVRPESLRVAADGPADLTATVESARFAGTHVRVEVRLDAGPLLVADLPVGTDVVVGRTVGLSPAPDSVTVLPI